MKAADWIVGRAGARDLAPLADLMAASPLLQRYGTSRATAIAALGAGHRAGDLILVGRHRGRPPSGFAWVIPSRILTGAAYLRLLLVHGERQRTGLGSRLLVEAEAGARRWANHLVLLVTTDNADARRFYERHGYRHVGDLPGFAVPALDEALYQKALRPPGPRLPV